MSHVEFQNFETVDSFHNLYLNFEASRRENENLKQELVKLSTEKAVLPNNFEEDIEQLKRDLIKLRQDKVILQSNLEQQIEEIRE